MTEQKTQDNRKPGVDPISQFRERNPEYAENDNNDDGCHQRIANRLRRDKTATICGGYVDSYAGAVFFPQPKRVLYITHTVDDNVNDVGRNPAR